MNALHYIKAKVNLHLIVNLIKSEMYIHCVKCVQIRSFFWSVFSHIWTEYEPEETPYLDTFHAVICSEYQAKISSLLVELNEKVGCIERIYKTEDSMYQYLGETSDMSLRCHFKMSNQRFC